MQNTSAVVWRKGILLQEVIFEIWASKHFYFGLEKSSWEGLGSLGKSWKSEMEKNDKGLCTH